MRIPNAGELLAPLFAALPSVEARSKRRFQSPEKIPKTTDRTELEIPAIRPENLGALHKLAVEYVKKTKRGQFESYASPLSEQVCKDFKKLYRELEPYFSEADVTRKKVRNIALLMRIITFVTFFLFVYFAVTVLDDFSEASINSALKNKEYGELAFAALPLIIALVSALFRSARIERIISQATTFGGVFNNRLKYLADLSGYALDNVELDRVSEKGNEERAEQWSFVALWLYDYYEIYDRYVTVAQWRVETGFRIITLVSRVLKWIVFVYGVICLVAVESANPVSVWLSGAIIIAAIFCWDFLPGSGKPNSLFGDQFSATVTANSEQQIVGNHPNTKISEMAKKLRQQANAARKLG